MKRDVNDYESTAFHVNILFPIYYRVESNKDVADIKLSRVLDYESNTQYSLIVRVQNNYQLAAETVVDIEVLDANDEIPVFRDIKRGSVLENEPPGVPVMQVRAIDADGTSANNQVLKLHINHILCSKSVFYCNYASKFHYRLALNAISRLSSSIGQLRVGQLQGPLCHRPANWKYYNVSDV